MINHQKIKSYVSSMSAATLFGPNLVQYGTSFFQGEYDSYINGIDPCDASDTKAASANDSAATLSATSSSSFSTAASPNFEFQASVVCHLPMSDRHTFHWLHSLHLMFYKDQGHKDQSDFYLRGQVYELTINLHVHVVHVVVVHVTI